MCAIRRCIQNPDGHTVRMKTMYLIAWVQQELQSAQEKQIPILSWLQIVEHTLLQIQTDILRYGTSFNRHVLLQAVMIGLYLPKTRWMQCEQQELYPSVVSTSGPLLSTAPTTLGPGTVAVGATTTRATTPQCSLSGLSDPPDPPPAAASLERAVA